MKTVKIIINEKKYIRKDIYWKIEVGIMATYAQRQKWNDVCLPPHHALAICFWGFWPTGPGPRKRETNFVISKTYLNLY